MTTDEMTMQWAEISTDCNCETEDENGEMQPSTECFGCYEDDKEFIHEIIAEWMTANADKATDKVRIEGSRMGWMQLDGFAIADADADSILKTMAFGGDWRIRFYLHDGALTASRWSHDEPMGASFTFLFIPEEIDLA